LTLDLILDSPPDVVARTSLGVASFFPSSELVSAAAALFVRETVPDTLGRFTTRPDLLDYSGNLRPSAVQALALFPETDLGIVRERVLVEGPRWRVEVGPGVVAVRSSDPARRERALKRAEEDHVRIQAEMVARIQAGEPEPEAAPQRGVRSWSSKSRSRMVQRLAELDYAPMFAHGERSAMVTLTYPGDWLTVAPDSATCHKHLLSLRKRFERFFGVPLVAVWKREFQLRGAPHYHLLLVPPTEDRTGAAVNFKEWLSASWADIVGHPDTVQRHRHLLVGTGVDYTEGARVKDPKRLGVYFSKHGSFAAKDYQNNAPEEWDGTSVGRFWGYWHLQRAVSAVEVAPDVARLVLRTARRYSDSRSYMVQVSRWRKVTTVDRETGELGWKWRKRRTKVWVKRLRGPAGYLVVNDGPVLASALARYAGMSTTPRPAKVKRGRRLMAGPVGYLP